VWSPTIPALTVTSDRQLVIGVRPSSFEDAALAQASELPRLKAEVAVTEELGAEVNVIFPVATPPVHHDIMIAKFDKAAKDHLETKHLAGEGDSLWTAQVDPKTSARSGRTLELTVDACSLYWFDRDSGQAIGRGPSDRTQAQLEARLAPA
jgi:multiple sugar transport system ATP-binding protein